MMSRGVFLLAILVAVPLDAVAQSSIYDVVGLGLPGRRVGIHARAMGGSLGALDPGSAINPAAVVGVGRLSATAALTAGFRSYEANGQSVTGLRDTRFPVAMLAGPIPGSRFTFAVGYVQYTDRTFDVRTSDSVPLGTDLIAVDDRVRSEGGVVDVRMALGYVVSPRVWLGLGAHVLSGATREGIVRVFGDSAYAPVAQQRYADYSARGVSLGALLSPSQWLRFGIAVRQDFRLTTRGSLFGVGDMDLPLSVSAGVMLVPAPTLRAAATATWSSWSRAADGLAAFPGGTAFDTYDVGAGLEVGGIGLGLPVRVGARYATLPFSPNDEQPREFTLSTGTGIGLAGGLGALDLALERVTRDGAGVSERAWQLSAGLRVRP